MYTKGRKRVFRTTKKRRRRQKGGLSGTKQEHLVSLGASTAITLLDFLFGFGSLDKEKETEKEKEKESETQSAELNKKGNESVQKENISSMEQTEKKGVVQVTPGATSSGENRNSGTGVNKNSGTGTGTRRPNDIQIQILP